MKAFVFFVLIQLPFFVVAQKDKTIYFDVKGKTATSDQWIIKKEIDYKTNRKIKVTTIKLTENKEQVLFAERISIIDESTFEIKVKGKVFSKGIYRKFEKLENGLFKFTDYEGEKIKRFGFTTTKIPLNFQDEVTDFYSNGTKKSVSVYKDNELISNKNWLENGEPYIENIFYFVDEEPLFKGGMGYVHEHILKTFNKSGLDLSRVSGKIKVGFVVKENGRIDGIKIEEGINGTLDNLALQAFRTLLGEWTPAKLNGENVRCFQLFPINFIYTEYDYDYVEMSGSMLYWEIN